jgi:TolB-like protein
MPDNPGKVSRFWQELKRRKVIKSVAMYAATAFIVIEAGDIVLPRLGLPDWTVTFLIVLIIVGFPITIILSWIFDVSQKGFEKTEPESQEHQETASLSRVNRKIKPSDIIIAALLVIVCVLLYPKLFHKDKFESFRDDQGRISLAVMPFENLTGDTTLNYFQRGISSYLSNDLGNSPQLAVRDEQSIFELTTDLGEVNYAGFTTSSKQEMARMLKAETFLSGSFQGRSGNYLILVDLIDSSAMWIKRAWETREDLPAFYQDWLELWHACYVSKNIQEVRRSCTRLQQTGTDSRFFWYDLGITQLGFLEDYDNAVKSFDRVKKISEERGGPWKYSPYYGYYTEALHKAGNHIKEKEINKLGKSIFPRSGTLLFNEGICIASMKKWDLVSEKIGEFREFWDEYGTEPKIREYYVGLMFENAGIPDSVLVHHRRSYTLDPDDPYRHITLASILIEYDYDVEEAMDLLRSITDTVLNSDAIYCYLLGWGYLKLGQPGEAMPLLQKATEICINANKDYDDRLREAERAVAQAKR